MKKRHIKVLVLGLILIISFSIGMVLYKGNNKSNKTVPRRAKFVRSINYFIN